MSSRYVLFSVGLAILFCSFVAGQATVSQDSEKESLRVLSYNIHMWQINVDDLTNVIRESNADVIGLNEAWNKDRNDAIAEKTGYNIVYGGQTEKAMPAKAHTINGFYMPQVLLTKHKIVESKVFNAVESKGHESYDPNVPIYRGGTLAKLETRRGNQFLVFVLHLHPWGDGKNERMTTMRLAELNGILKTLEPYRELPILIIGDFNTQSHLESKDPWKVTRRLDKAGYVDLFRAVHPDAIKHAD